MASKADDKLHFDVSMSQAANDILEEAAKAQHTTKSEVLGKAVSLIKVASDARARNGRIGVMFDGNVFSEIVGL